MLKYKQISVCPQYFMGHILKVYPLCIWNSNLTGLAVFLFGRSSNPKQGEIKSRCIFLSAGTKLRSGLISGFGDEQKILS